MDDAQFGWLRFKPELGPPTLVESLALLGIVVCLIVVGHLVKKVWDRNNELVPVSVALIVTFGMYVAYFLVTSMLYNRTPDDQKSNFLLWAVVALAFPAVYYGRMIVNSCATRVIDHISPFNMRIEEPSEFAEARKLALRRDIDGAVKRYRAYLDNTEGALFEAARLLKAEDRFAEAAALFQEISERFYGKKLVWAEATYHLAKVKEASLHQATEAIMLLESILDRTPDSRFGQLAQTEIVRLRSLYTADRHDGVSYAEADEPEDPFFEHDAEVSPGRRQPRMSQADNGRRNRSPMDDLEVPPVDPFYVAAARDDASTADDRSADDKDTAADDSASAQQPGTDH